MRFFLAIACLTVLCACEDNEMETKVLDAVVASTDAVFSAIDGDMTTWITDVETGQDINGELVNAEGGTLMAFGWRNNAQYDNGQNLHVSFGEKLFMTMNQWNANGMNITGTLVVTRHHMDFGPSGSDISDAHRKTSYLGTMSTTGEVEGSFDVDVHAQAAGSTVWTCGLIGEAEIEHGACF